MNIFLIITVKLISQVTQLACRDFIFLTSLLPSPLILLMASIRIFSNSLGLKNASHGRVELIKIPSLLMHANRRTQTDTHAHQPTLYSSACRVSPLQGTVNQVFGLSPMKEAAVETLDIQIRTILSANLREKHSCKRKKNTNNQSIPPILQKKKHIFRLLLHSFTAYEFAFNASIQTGSPFSTTAHPRPHKI